MFDPRTLPNGEFWPNVGIVFLYVALLFDTLAAYYGQSQFSPAKSTKTLWIGPQTSFWAFLNAAPIRMSATIIVAVFIPYLGFPLGIAPLINFIRNFIKIKSK